MRGPTRDRRRGLVHDALRVIAADPARRLELDDVAHEIATSRRSLQRAFEVQGITFRQAVSVARIHRAKILFAESDAPVYVVARQVGYRSKAEFTKAFKRHTGELPSAYRRAMRRKRDMERQWVAPVMQREPQYA
jgi:AraC-like DNA-binding protein